MNILHFIYDHPGNPWVGGGGARRVAAVGRLLAGRGHRVRLISGRYPDCRTEESDRFCWDFLGSGRNYPISTFSFMVASRQFLARHAREYDLVIEDFAPWNPLFSYRLKSPPAILQIQNYFGRNLPRKYPVVGLPFFWIEKFYPRRFRNAVVVNASLNTALGLQAKVIPMGVDESWLKCETSDQGYVAFLGRLDFRQKGLDILLRAARDLEIPFRIAGDGPDREKLKKTIASLDHIEWTGPLDDLEKRDFLRNASMVALPSRFEGQPLVSIEAAALGKPLVVSDIAELRFVEENGFGVSFPLGEPDRLAAKIRELWKDPVRREQLGLSARNYAANFTWPRIADQFEQYCREVVERQK